MEYWITSSFIHKSSIDRFQDELIFKGKIIYLMNLILDQDDHVLFRFSEEDLEWCNIHESNIWKEIISLDLMYSKDYNSYVHFSQTLLSLKECQGISWKIRILGRLQNYRFLYE